MTDQTTIKRRRGGRPPNPQPPQNAGDCRALIAQETVRTKPSQRRLRQLYRLLKAFVAAEVQAAAESKTKALTDANELKTAELELKRAEYLRRMSLGPLGVRNLQAENERLKQRVASLEANPTRKDGSIECPAR